MATSNLLQALADFIVNLPKVVHHPSPESQIDIDFLLSHIINVTLPLMGPPPSLAPLSSMSNSVPPQPAPKSKPDQQRVTGKRKERPEEEVKREEGPIDMFKIRQIQKARALKQAQFAAASGSQSNFRSTGSSGSR